MTKTTPKNKNQYRVRGAASIRKKELSLYTRQLSAMLESGMPLIQCMSALEDQTEHKGFKELLGNLRGSVEGGSMYSEALGKYPQVFDELYVNMMKAGEMSGMLPETCDKVAGFLEASNALKAKVKSAMMYPTVVMIVALVICTALIVFIVPVFAEMFGGMGGELPAATQILVDISEFIKSYWYIVIAVVGTTVYTLRRYVATEKGAYTRDLFFLNFPIMGVLVQKVAITRFASTFAQLMDSGVPIIQAMDIVGVATGNKVVGKAVLDARSAVESGKTISSVLKGNKAFPTILVHMLSAGEETGKIGEMLSRLAKFYQDEVDTMLEGLTSMLEPILMVVIGAMIGGIVLAMFMPIFKMSSLVM